MIEKNLEWEKKLAVIVLNYNGAKMTKSCVSNIRNLSSDIKIIVVDNCSTDDSVFVLEPFIQNITNCFFVKNKSNAGYAAGNNIGIRYVESNLEEVDTICVMNPDIRIQNIFDLKELYVALWNKKNMSIITAQTIYNGKIRMPNDFGWKHLTPFYMMFGGTLLGKILKPSLRYDKVDVDSNMVAEIDIAQGCFFMGKLKIFSEIDYLDEGTFLYSEEAILAKKMQRDGYFVGVLMNVYVEHNHKEKDSKLINKNNKLFDMKCFYDSRKYYIKKYSGCSKIFISSACFFLNIDHTFKKILCLLK